MKYKVVRAFERWEGKALRKYARGEIITPKEAARMSVRHPRARNSTLDTLLASGAIYGLPDENKPEVLADGKIS